MLIPNSEHIYTVSQLCRESRLLLEGNFLTVAIEGEISNLSRPASGHIYFTLKDEKAQIQCAMFRPQLRKIIFKPSNGMHVSLKARVTLYEARGNFQLIVEHMEAAGEGALRQKFEALKRKLSAEGLFAESNKKPLPSLAKKIAVITSSSGAALHDILTVLNRRFSALPVLIYPVTVQGENAKNEISDAIELANARQDCDVIILARGGGSLEDLWAFNEELVARAIYHSEIPIISAVGHEVDVTIADFVADYRAATPSAAAETISPDQQQWLKHFDHIAQKMATLLTNQLSGTDRALASLQHRLKQAHPGIQLQMHAQRLDDYQIRLARAPKQIIQHNKLKLSELNSRLMANNPQHSLHTFQQQLEQFKNRLAIPLQKSLERSRIRFTKCHKGLETLSPLATLSRGYSISTLAGDGMIIKSTKQVKLGDSINIQLADGTLRTRLDKIHDNT